MRIRTLMVVGLAVLPWISVHAASTNGEATASTAEAVFEDSSAAKNPCGASVDEALDPQQIMRPADISPFSGVERTVLVDEGRALFEDSSLSGNGLSCASCHTGNDGFGAGFATPYPHPVEMARKKLGVDRALFADEVVQLCLLVPMKGQPLAWDSRELAALTAYVADVKQKAFMAAPRPLPTVMETAGAGKEAPCPTKGSVAGASPGAKVHGGDGGKPCPKKISGDGKPCPKKSSGDDKPCPKKLSADETPCKPVCCCCCCCKKEKCPTDKPGGDAGGKPCVKKHHCCLGGEKSHEKPCPKGKGGVQGNPGTQKPCPTGKGGSSGSVDGGAKNPCTPKQAGDESGMMEEEEKKPENPCASGE